ncbi:hypothetical protein I6A84_41315 [Frankia sp. CNm7]|uniref:Uncharacterized protein n=1 Tax=Frankia nepalensis TaxID=1836974 RepID=A0A937RMU1_9ACTN|nr:hypothetical protein [Frankia nepalensis]MBL7500222.1 hypothetical protein [Frankia nepalensis]MBL7514603.1 hypothetical protein [Frankia nepalensis]MBL7524311.1 hypothetical protein [Frankia nepalensis]MBL7631684.1 hypothetical protein [Frankia nepalensis]
MDDRRAAAGRHRGTNGAAGPFVPVAGGPGALGRDAGQGTQRRLDLQRETVAPVPG